VSFRPKSIEGVSTSTTAFVGPALKGPLSRPTNEQGVVTPEVITSFGEFERVFGGLGNLSFDPGTDSDPQRLNYLPHAAKAFFDNGGGRLFVARTFQPRLGDANAGVARSNPFVGAGNPAAEQARFVARMPGAGLNGQVAVTQKSSRVSDRTLASAPQGSLLRTGVNNPATPAILQGSQPPFHLADGDRLSLDVSGNAVQLVLNGTRAEVVSDMAVANPAAINIPANSSLQVTITGWPAQTIPLPAGAGQTLAELAVLINAAMRLGHAEVRGGDRLAVVSDLAGTGVQVSVQAMAELGFTAAAAANGGGNVGRLDAVTVAELNNLLPGGSNISIGQSASTGRLVISTTAAGAAATLIARGATAAAFGLGNDPVTNQDSPQVAGGAGTQPLYLRKQGNVWLDPAGTVQANPLQNGAALVTLTVIMRYPDGGELAFDDLGFSTAHPRWAGEILKEDPTRKSDALLNPIFLSIGATLLARSTLPFDLHQGLFGAQESNLLPLLGGNDGAEPADPQYEVALDLLNLVDDISIIAAPGSAAHSDATQAQAIQDSLIQHAEQNRYRIAVLDSPPGLTPGDALDWRSRIDTKYAALYFPWVMAPNPNANPGDERVPKEIALPPSGFVAGVYARTDITRGVWKPPANEIVRGALRFERDVTYGQQELLNPRGVNCLRFFYGRGYRIWGARTASSDPEWKYVNVRRYFIYLEKSIDRSTQWAVFEPNGEALWANIRETVSAFLYNEWYNGALLGSKPEEAYFVRCDRSTMTQNDLDNGRLICLVGVAALKPAEFVIFRIGQKTADARS
jgi:hypothetical protein